MEIFVSLNSYQWGIHYKSIDTLQKQLNQSIASLSALSIPVGPLIWSVLIDVREQSRDEQTT